jgi:hypothetical protein
VTCRVSTAVADRLVTRGLLEATDWDGRSHRYVITEAGRAARDERLTTREDRPA